MYEIGTASNRRPTACRNWCTSPIVDHEAPTLYGAERSDLLNYTEGTGPTLTTPPGGYANAEGQQVSCGYQNDECDGLVRVDPLWKN